MPGRRMLLGVFALCCLLVATSAWAGGPRYVTGPPFFHNQGNPVSWGQNNLLYSTDPADLSASVNHAAADALVLAAASVWNIPQSRITLGRGGSLLEHVSGANTYLGPGGMVFPPDVASSNAAAVPIAVIYDADGSVTDTLLGSGASNPLSCRQNAVTETVDLFDPNGYILHAILIINGRCTGPAAAQQLQLQYQLERVFGRVLGLAWSQTNDNVLMGSPTPTYNQALHWPLMHPIDVICGPYTYQCLPYPFQLRDDDIAGLLTLYAVQDGTTQPGKQPALEAAEGVFGEVSFPTGQGMAGVNVLARRASLNDAQEGWFESSAVTGTTYRRSGTSPFVAADNSVVGSEGAYDQSLMGRYRIAYVPIQAGQTAQDVVVSLEAVNPLYEGALSLGPYPLGAVVPSGTLPTPQTVVSAFADGDVLEYFSVPSAASICGYGLDGSSSAPAAMPSSGWWDGLLCGYGHAAYTALEVRAGHTLTIEVTALDDTGLATTAKAMPVIGLFAPTDQGNALPSVGVAGVAFNSAQVGTTVLHAATGQLTQMRLGVADQRGDGRPDYRYQARVFYADTVLPVQVASAGAKVTVSGVGFRQGNQVLVHGVAATAVSSSANSLEVTVPPMAAAHASLGSAVDVEVVDLSTGATSTISNALTYTAAPVSQLGLKVVSAPVGNVYAGVVAGTPFAVQVVGADGTTPIAGQALVFSASAGQVVFASCGAALCTVQTGADGIASTAVQPGSSGPVTLTATDGTLQGSVSFNVLAQDGKMTVISAPSGVLPVTVEAAVPFSVQVFNAAGQGDAGRLITFSVGAGQASYGNCSSSVCAVTTDGSGTATLSVTPTAPGPVSLTATDGSLTQSVLFTATAYADVMKVLSAPAAVNYVGQSSTFFGIQLLHGDGRTPDSFEHVVFSAPAGVTLSACGGPVCDVTTNGVGATQTTISTNLPGTYTITAAYGAVTQSITVLFSLNTLQLNVISGPAGNQTVGQMTSVPFTLRLAYTNGTPSAGVGVIVQGPRGEVVLNACGNWSCSLATDGNGLVSTGVTPLLVGAVTLSAVVNNLLVTDSFVSVAPVDTLKFLATPQAGTFAASLETLTVQVFLPDGTTPAVGKTVTFSVTDGSFLFSSSSGSTCTATTNAQGQATVTGTSTQPGSVTVQASEGGGSASASFSTLARPDVLRLLSGPTGNVFAGSTAATPFTVQVLSWDGTTPQPSRSIVLSVGTGTATFNVCGAASCTVKSDANGIVTSLVTAGTVGVAVIQASEGAALVADTFSVVQRPDVLRLISSPANGGFPGAAESVAFTVQALLGDGVTPAAGHTVLLAGAAGAVTLGACGGAASCSVTADANGLVSSTVTPLTTGTLLLTATDQSAVVTASFTVIARPDVLRLISAPGGTLTVGSTSSAFTVQLLQGDGTTPDAGKALLFTATSAGRLTSCNAASCTPQTDANGIASTSALALAPGTLVLEASIGSLVQSVSLQVIAKPDVLSLVSVPADGSPVGSVATLPFAVRLLLADEVTPDAGKTVSLLVTDGSAQLQSCGATSCDVITDATGLASSLVLPGAPGLITLAAKAGAQSVSRSFTALARPDTLSVVTVPLDGSWAGEAAATPFAVRLVLGDGVTPDAGRNVTVTVTNGNGILNACGAASCSLLTDSLGMAATAVTPGAAGVVTLSAAAPATGGSAAVSASFVAAAKPDRLQLIQAPEAAVFVGAQSLAAFVVRVTLSDGATPVAGAQVIFSAGPQVSLLACGASSCQVTTDSNGLAQTGVLGLSAGAVTLTASYAGASVTAGFAVVANQQSLTAAVPVFYLAEAAVVAVELQAIAIENTTPASGQTVQWSASAGLALAAPSSATDGTGTARIEALVGPLPGGALARAQACAWAGVCTGFSLQAVSAAEQQVQVLSGGTQTLAQGVVPESVVAQITDGGGHALAAAVVTAFQTVSAVDQNCPPRGRCAAMPVLAESETVLVPGWDGMVRITPLTVPGTATETRLLLTVGTAGVASATVSMTP